MNLQYFIDVLFNILTSGLPCCLLALGVFMTFRLLDFADMTAEGSFLLGAAACAAIIYNGGNPFVATIASFFVGGLCGVVTGVLHTKLQIPKLLSGIITLTASASIALLIIGTTTKYTFSNLVTLRNDSLTIFSMFYTGVGKYNQLIETLVLLVVVVLVSILVYFFFGTEYGMAVRSTGMNGKMARAQGINTTLATIVCVALSNALIGLAGGLFAQDSRSVDVKSASGYLVIGLASIIIGESIFGKRTFKNWMISVLLGAIVYFIIVNVAIALGFPTQLKNLLYATLITIALCIPLFKALVAKIKKTRVQKKEAKSC